LSFSSEQVIQRGLLYRKADFFAFLIKRYDECGAGANEDSSEELHREGV
jgi:hypothetical protein